MRIKAFRYLWSMAVLALLMGAAIVYRPWENPRNYRSELRDDEVRNLAVSLTTQPPQEKNRSPLADFGKALFFDPRFSANQMIACAHCHKPEKYFTDGLDVSHGLNATQRNSPTIINASYAFWFFWDGRADSLAAQALEPIENPAEHGISRTRVAHLLLTHYRQAYETSFGAFPHELTSIRLAEDALPPPVDLEISSKIAAYALTTLPYADLSPLLTTAAAAERSPAKEYAQRVRSEAEHPAAWYRRWETLPPTVKDRINEVFANFGRAIAAFEAVLQNFESPFDHFAQRLALNPDIPLHQALDKDFGEEELHGFKIFAGRANCILCHHGPAFSDSQFHNTGIPVHNKDLAMWEPGRARGVLYALQSPFNCLSAPSGEPQSESCAELPYLDTDNIEMLGAFKTPTLRNLKHTAPYMHDGSINTLESVIDFYDQLAEPAILGHREESLQPLQLTVAERAALLAFLRSLDGPLPEW